MVITLCRDRKAGAIDGNACAYIYLVAYSFWQSDNKAALVIASGNRINLALALDDTREHDLPESD